MSKIADLGDKKAVNLKDRFKNLPSILAEYDEALEEAEPYLTLKGKTLVEANRENASRYAFYDERRVELKTLVEYIESQVQRVRGQLFRGFTEQYNRDLSDRAKDKYIDSEQAYLDIYEIYLEVKEMYDQYSSVVEAFKLQGYALRNITEARVASVENATI
jgi:hypothetical protein